MMKAGLLLFADSTCRLLTAGIFLPSFGTLQPPARHATCSPSVTGRDRARARRTEARVKRDLGNYQRLRGLTDEWIELSIELAKLDKSSQAA